MTVSKKNKSINEISLKNPFMLGFPSSSLSKYLKILIDVNYTIIIIDQITPPPSPQREITGIYTPGIYISDSNNINNDSNDAINIINIYLEETNDLISKKPLISCGVSIVDLTTGKTMIYEIYASKEDDKYSLDELIKYINSY